MARPSNPDNKKGAPAVSKHAGRQAKKYKATGKMYPQHMEIKGGGEDGLFLKRLWKWLK